MPYLSLLFEIPTQIVGPHPRSYLSLYLYIYRYVHTYKLSTNYPAPNLKAQQAETFSLMSSSKDLVKLGGTVGHVGKSLDASYVDKGLLWNVEVGFQGSLPHHQEKMRELYFG